MNVRAVASTVMVALLLTLSSAFAEEANGVFGLAVAIDGSGFFLNPTLRTVTVQKVEPRSPAASAGIAPGDQIVEMEGRAIAGTKAREMAPLLRKKVGQPLHLLLKHPSGETFKATLIAVAKPAGQ